MNKKEIIHTLRQIWEQEIHREALTHHVNTALTIVSWHIEMCENWNDCNNCKEVFCKNTQKTLNSIHNILMTNNIRENQKKELSKIPTVWFPNQQALDKIYKILNWAA